MFAMRARSFFGCINVPFSFSACTLNRKSFLTVEARRNSRKEYSSAAATWKTPSIIQLFHFVLSPLSLIPRGQASAGHRPSNSLFVFRLQTRPSPLRGRWGGGEPRGVGINSLVNPNEEAWRNELWEKESLVKAVPTSRFENTFPSISAALCSVLFQNGQNSPPPTPTA